MANRNDIRLDRCRMFQDLSIRNFIKKRQGQNGDAAKTSCICFCFRSTSEGAGAGQDCLVKIRT